MTTIAPHRGAPSYFALRERFTIWEALFWCAALATYFLFPSYLLLGSQVLILGLFALSLDLILGYAGIISFGHAAFLGIGAYTAGLLAKHGWSEPISGLLLAGIVAALCGLASSAVVVRMRGIGLIVVTLGIGLLVHELANRFSGITGGEDGLQGIVMDPILGIFNFDLWGRTAYLYALVVVFVMTMLARRIVRSPFGLNLRARRENETRMPAMGASIMAQSAVIYTISAFYAGIAGALLAQTTEYVAIDVLSVNRSAEVLVMLILGGTGFLYGGFVGAAAFLLFRDVVASASPQYWYFWMGLALVIVVLLGRNGLVGILVETRALARRLRGRKP